MKKGAKKLHPKRKVAEGSIPSVALFIETGTSWGRRVISGVLAYAKQHGPWHIHVEPCGPDEPIHVPRHWKGDGIIARISSQSIARKLQATLAPIVNVSAINLPGTEFYRVMTSPSSTSRIAVEVFQSRGFRNFGYVGDLGKGYVQEQFRSFKTLLGKTGHTTSFFNSRNNKDAMIRWLKSLPKPVGVFCWGPIVGREVIDCCLTAGIHVPHDVAVLGGDYDEIFSDASYPAQSGIKLSAEQIGMTAAAVLHQIISESPPIRREWVIEPMGVIEKLSTNTLAVDDKRMAAVMQYIMDHSHEPILVKDILLHFPMARRSLERNFRRHFRCTLADQIRRVRVNQSRLLLGGGEEPITLIAEKCGFSSYNYMGRVFKDATGLTPREYRLRALRGKL